MKASPESLQAWQSDPQAQIAVIVHVAGDARQYVDAVSELGMSGIRAFRLTNTIAARGSARCVLDLLEQVERLTPRPSMRIEDLAIREQAMRRLEREPPSGKR